MRERICGAKTRAGQPCRGQPMQPSGRCRLHGGRTPRGPANANYRTGRYSKVLPTQLWERYATAARDPDLLSLRDELALIDARLAELLSRLDRGESDHHWQAVQQAFHTYRAVRGRPDSNATFAALSEAITRAGDEATTWREICVTLDQRQRLVLAEHQRMVRLQQYLPVDQATALAQTLLQAVRDAVDDPETLQRIGKQISIIMEHRGVGTVRSRVIGASPDAA